MLLGAVVGAVAVAPAFAVGEKVVAYGADLTLTERQELAQLFGVDAQTRVETVGTQELVAALQDTGLPVGPTDRAISSSLLTCLGRDDGLTVRTQNITRIPAAVYANALVTAGVDGGAVLIAAPPANPVTGETALVGVLKSFAGCPGGRQTDPARARLAYEQVGRTVALAGPDGDLATASNVMFKAAQPVITGQARGGAAIGAALDAAAASEGLALDPAQRAATIDFLGRLGGVDYGIYARGYQVQQPSRGEARVIPAGAGPGSAVSPTSPPAPSAPSGAAGSPTPSPATGLAGAGGAPTGTSLPPSTATGTPSPSPAATGTPAAARTPNGQDRSPRAIWEDSVDQLSTSFVSFVPRIVGALAVVAVGVVLAVIARGVAGFALRRLRFDALCERIGVTGLLLAGNIRRSPSRLFGAAVFYAILLFTLLAALGPLGLGFLTQTLNGLILFAPRVLIAALLLVLGIAAAGLVAQATARTLAEAGVTRVAGLRSLIRFGLIFIVAVLAAAVLGIDVTLLVAIAVIGLSALALTAALAIGLGLRGLSQNIAAARYVAEGIAEGDRISVNGVAGTVEAIGYAVTTLRGANGRVYLVPNAYFLEHVVEKEAALGGEG